MGILKFLRYKISRRYSPSSGAVIDDSLCKSFYTSNVYHNKHDADDDKLTQHMIIKDDFVVRGFTWDEIAKVTMDFSQLIGYGGFSNVYLAYLPDATLAAVKSHNCTTERLYRVFKQELEVLLHINHHDHVVKLLGFYDDQEKAQLVFEYMENGTLQEKLHCDDGLVLSWRNRMQIAYQVAQAIEYLHEECSPHIIHGDIKSSNILLDNNFDCKLCDFGSAKMGFSSALALLPCKKHRFIMMGSPGYVDPHYLKTGITSKKNDIYSFGVLLLELITGMEAFSPETRKMLTSSTDHALKLALDPRLSGNFDSEEATVMFSIARLCLGHSPTLRPSVSAIVFSMQHQIPSIHTESKIHKSL